MAKVAVLSLTFVIFLLHDQFAHLLWVQTLILEERRSIIMVQNVNIVVIALES